jgi:ABC-type uncharacterized transport system ATPase subunit
MRTIWLKMKPLLTIHSLEKRYCEEPVLQVERLEYKKYGLNFIVGRNGSGKSTLLKLIAGLENPTKGHVAIHGKALNYLPPFKRQRIGIAIAFQTPCTVSSLSVNQNILLPLLRKEGMFALLMKKSALPIHIERTKFYLSALGINGLGEKMAGDLTFSEQKLLDVACALAQETPLVLLDEPTAGLTEEQYLRLAKVLDQFASAHCVLVVEHNIHFLRQFNASVTLLRRGRVIFEGNSNSEETKHKFEEHYFS